MQRALRLRHSISFRLTLNYGLLALFTALVLVAVISAQVMAALHNQTSRQISATAQRLQIAFEEGGRPELVRAIELTLSDRIDSDREIYLLLDQNGRRLAGNLDALPLQSSPGAMMETTISESGHESRGQLQVLHLSDGSTLAVGHDLSEREHLSALIGQAVFAAVVVALLLVVAGTLIFKRELEYRVGTIRRIAEQIGAGRLSQRIPLHAAEDEFSHLSRDINTMLDKIEALMKGVRHVSDTIAHNLRTPLTRVVVRLRDAQQPGRLPEEVLTATRHAMEDIENLNVLFDKLLQIAELEAGMRRQPFELCRLDTIAADVVDMYDALADDRGLALTCHAREAVQAEGDPDLLASALANLVDNALKHARTRVDVLVEVDKTGARIMSVQDDGPGLAPEEISRVERHFYRAGTQGEGHGLGLTSVRAIVSLHKGKLLLTTSVKPGLKASLVLPAPSPQHLSKP